MVDFRCMVFSPSQTVQSGAALINDCPVISGKFQITPQITDGEGRFADLIEDRALVVDLSGPTG